MKKLLLLTIMAFALAASHAQFSSAQLQATGLTCAMCSNAINKSLQKVPFVEKVQSDIRNSTFNITFRSGVAVSIDALRKAVEDAGFSVGSLKLTGDFNQVKIGNDAHVAVSGINFHFVNAKEQVVSGTKTITVVDRDFLSAKDFKKWSAATRMSCIQTGKAASCCVKEGMPDGARVYHVTI